MADRIHSAAAHLVRRLHRRDDASGLTAPRLAALSILVFDGPRMLRELADAEQVRPPTMTRLIDALEARGLVKRVVDPADARRVRISATAKGRAILTRGYDRRVKVLARQLRTLTPNELATLDRAAALLDRIAGEL